MRGGPSERRESVTMRDRSREFRVGGDRLDVAGLATGGWV